MDVFDRPDVVTVIDDDSYNANPASTAAAVGFLVSLFGTPLAIRGFTRLKFGQPIRISGPQPSRS